MNKYLPSAYNKQVLVEADLSYVGVCCVLGSVSRRQNEAWALLASVGTLVKEVKTGKDLITVTMERFNQEASRNKLRLLRSVLLHLSLGLQVLSSASVLAILSYFTAMMGAMLSPSLYLYLIPILCPELHNSGCHLTNPLSSFHVLVSPSCFPNNPKRMHFLLHLVPMTWCLYQLNIHVYIAGGLDQLSFIRAKNYLNLPLLCPRGL